jgi:hypothetical protein
MMALGAITLIALILPGEGALTDWWRDSIAPWFETGRWLLPFLLLAGGWWIAAGPGKKAGSGWGMTLGGLAIAYIAALGAFEILAMDLFAERGGGRIGRFLATTLEPLLTGPGAIIVLVAIGLLGLMLAFNLQLRQLVSPVAGTARWVGSTTAESLRRAQDARPGDAGAAAATNGTAKGKAAAKEPVAIPLRSLDDAARSILDEPAPRSGQSPMSQTVWTGASDGGSNGSSTRPAFGAAAARSAVALAGDAPTALESLNAIDWTLPDIDLLEPRSAARVSSSLEHAAHRGEAPELLDPGQGRGGQLGPGRDPVRGPPGTPRQGLAHRGPGG